MREIQYSSPKENKERGEEPKHTVEIKVEGEVVGAAEIEYFSKPMPFYQITDLYVDYEHQGKGYASRVMDFVENMLRDKKKPGVLVDAVLSTSTTPGFYARRGWKSIPGGNRQYIYNLADGIDINIFQAYHERGTDLLDRPAYRKKFGFDD